MRQKIRVKQLFLKCIFYQIRPPAQLFLCEFCDMFQNRFFIEHLWTAVSVGIFTGSRL